MNIEVAPKETEIKVNWYDAMMYCQFLEVDGKTDWRLPTKAELDYISHFEFEIWETENDFTGSYYWSSTEGNFDHAWCQNMISGRQRSYLKNGALLYVRAVRDI